MVHARGVASSSPDELALLPQTLPAPLPPVATRLAKSNLEYRRLLLQPPREHALEELLHGTAHTDHRPDVIFRKLRWGGLFVFASRRRHVTRSIARQFEQAGFHLDTPPTRHREGSWIPFPPFSQSIHFFVARKVHLLPPGEFTDRFTYSVQLVGHDDPAEPVVVEKCVPTLDAVVARLRAKFPDTPREVIERRARKFTDRIFPLFLTREAGMLLVLEERLPSAYRRRVPRLLHMERDERGFVTRLKMTWLRNGGRPLSHMEFARQSADLLRVLHDVAHVIHLDLRLDNMVVTPDGVGFVDFGSAVKDDEDLSQNPLLGQVFGELMKTSQIQRMLEHMSSSGQVTSEVLLRGRQKVDKAVDLFYLALQFKAPNSNPDLADLIQFKPGSDEAHKLSKLSEEVLRPANAVAPTFRSAKDLLHGVERIMLRLDRG